MAALGFEPLLQLGATAKAAGMTRGTARRKDRIELRDDMRPFIGKCLLRLKLNPTAGQADKIPAPGRPT